MDSKFVVVRVCQNINEALLLRSVLESSGVDSFIPDENVLSQYPSISVVTKGVQLAVRQEDQEQAEDILDSVEEDDEY
jgi:hypothetical protein